LFVIFEAKQSGRRWNKVFAIRWLIANTEVKGRLLQ